MGWRVTNLKVKKRGKTKLTTKNDILALNTLMKISKRTEIRENKGSIIRLATGSELEIQDTPMGIQPVYHGEVFVSIKSRGGGGKYRTSCWMAEANSLSRNPDIFIKPGKEKNVDEFYAISGDISIFEIDENSMTFTICVVHEGEKALITYNSSATKIRNRYKAKVIPFTNKEYDYVLKKFIDRRKWV
ncbi:hypothetical protein [Sulfurimonas sp. CS5]|jgi:hypothetical protein|uniref:hypothetical protein n=1 Tax=Sulfurimonas sp. CS5 TaxID=3391145 RepID=UPI0039E9195F